MAVARALRRLLRVLEIEEEQCRAALESALSGLKRLEQARTAATERARRGRHLVISSAGSAEPADRLAGLEETRAGNRHIAALSAQIVAIEEEVAAQRAAYLAKRVERRQAETLIRETEARDAIQTDRRGQRTLDDWYLSQMSRADAAATLPDTSSPGSTPPTDKLARKKT